MATIIIFFLAFYISAKLKELFKNRLSDFCFFRGILSAFVAICVVSFVSYLLNTNMNIFGIIITYDILNKFNILTFILAFLFLVIISFLLDILIIYSKKILDWMYEALSNLFKNK